MTSLEDANEVALIIDESRKREEEFYARHGFPKYNLTEDQGRPRRKWLEVCEEERVGGGSGLCVSSPMARKMFILGYLKGKGAAE